MKRKQNEIESTSNPHSSCPPFATRQSLVWIQLYIGRSKSGDVHSIKTELRNISHLKTELKRDWMESLTQCDANMLYFFCSGTKIEDVTDERGVVTEEATKKCIDPSDVAPDDAAQSETPLIAVASPPMDDVDMSFWHQDSPSAVSLSASTVQSSSVYCATYSRTILAPEVDGTFVHVPTYTAFVEAIYNDTKHESQGTRPVSENNLMFAFHDHGKPETLRTAAIAAYLQAALPSQWNGHRISVVHQVPILPKKKKMEQKVDVAVFVDTTLLMVLKHKADDDFGDFEVQTSVYATDAGNMTCKSVIAVQSSGLT